MAKFAVYHVPYYHTVSNDRMRPYCLNYQNSSGELASTRLVYDNKGRNIRGLYQQIMGGRSSVNTHEFDGKGRMIRKSRAYNDGETSEETFVYDSRGRLLKETFRNSNGVTGTTTYIYDKIKHVKAMDCDRYKGWFTGRIEFLLDSEGKRKEGTLICDGKSVGNINYKYESSGNLTHEEWSTESGWSQTFQYVYESAE